MISRALSPCPHGWVEECASPPHLVTRPLLQSPADVLKTQQSVLTVLPRVRPHPIVLHCFHGDQEVTASLSEFHLTCRAAAQCTGKQDKSNFWNKFEYSSPDQSLPSKARRISLFIWLFPLSDIAGSDADTEVKRQSTPPGQTNGFSLVHQFAFHSHWEFGIYQPAQIIKPHCHQTVTLRENRLLEMKL